MTLSRSQLDEILRSVPSVDLSEEQWAQIELGLFEEDEQDREDEMDRWLSRFSDSVDLAPVDWLELDFQVDSTTHRKAIARTQHRACAARHHRQITVRRPLGIVASLLVLLVALSAVVYVIDPSADETIEVVTSSPPIEPSAYGSAPQGASVPRSISLSIGTATSLSSVSPESSTTERVLTTEINRLNMEIGDIEQDVNTLKDKLQREVLGQVTGDTSGIPGEGPIAAQIRSQIEQTEQELDRLQAERTNQVDALLTHLDQVDAARVLADQAAAASRTTTVQIRLTGGECCDVIVRLASGAQIANERLDIPEISTTGDLQNLALTTCSRRSAIGSRAEVNFQCLTSEGSSVLSVNALNRREVLTLDWRPENDDTVLRNEGLARPDNGPQGVIAQIPSSVFAWLDNYGWKVDWREGPGPGRISETQYATSTIVVWYETSRSDAVWAGALLHELGHAVSYVHFSTSQMNEWTEMRGLASWRWVPGTPNDFGVGEGDFGEALMSYLLGHNVRSAGGPLTDQHRAWIAANTPF